MAKITGIHNTSYKSFQLDEFLVGQLSGLLTSARDQFNTNVTTLSDRISTLFGSSDIPFYPAGLTSNTATNLKYMLSGKTSDTSLGQLEIKGKNLPTYSAKTAAWIKSSNDLSMSYIGYTNSSPDLSGEKFAIEGSLNLSNPKIKGQTTEKIDLSISKISAGNSDLSVSLLTDKLRIISQQYSDGTQIGDTVVSGTIKGIQIDIANDSGIYNSVSLGFSIGLSSNQKPVFSFNTITLTEGKSTLLSVSDIGIKIQDNGDGTSKITRGTTPWDQQGDLWDFVFGGNDSMQGTAENNSLDGGLGNDTLTGMLGDDTYYVNSSRDVIAEKTGEGYDSVVSTAQTYTLPVNVEYLSIDEDWYEQSFEHQDAKGNSAKNIIQGNSGNNFLSGKDGNDTLIGGYGYDQFIFDTKLNALNNVDVISDFTPSEDKIVLSSSIFKKSTGANKADFFSVYGVDAITKDTRILYDQNKGLLYYDADGNKSTYKPVLFAKLIGLPYLDGTADAGYFSF